MSLVRPATCKIGWLFLVAFGISDAGAASRKIPCTDTLTHQSEVNHIASIRDDLEDSVEFRKSRGAAADAVEKALESALREAKIEPSMKIGIQDVRVLIDNAIFDEALARAMKVANLKESETIQAFQARLGVVSLEEQLAFGELVVRQYRKLMDDAFEWIDKERFADVAARWNLDEESAYALMGRWQLIENTKAAEIYLGAMVWSKTVSADTILETMDSMRKIPGGQNLTDIEEVMISRIRKPFTDAQLARNVGPFTDAEFAKRLRRWNVVGWLRRRLFALRNPKESAFLTFMGGGTLVALAALSKDATFMLSLGTAATGLIGLAPVIEHLTKGVSRLQRTPAYLEIFTIGQLNELKRWVKENPAKSTEVGFENLLPAIEDRIEHLRKIRYAVPSAN